MNNPQTIIIYMIIACAALFLIFLFRKPFKTLAKAALRGAAGLAAIFMLNFAAAPFGAAVGINIATAAVVGVLGIPGLVGLYIIKFIAG